MNEYRVSYMDIEEDVTHVRIEAYSEEDAVVNVQREYWDVVSIIQIVKVK